MDDAIKMADIVVTATGNKDIVNKEAFRMMKDKIIVCNICVRGDKDIDTAEKMLGDKLDK